MERTTNNAPKRGKCPACGKEGIMYFNETTNRSECFDCAHPKPTAAQVLSGIVDLFKAFLIFIPLMFACDSRVSRPEAMMTGWRPTGGLISPFTDKQANFRLRFPVDGLDDGISPEPDKIIPEIVQGNQASIKPGSSAKVIQFGAKDSNAKMMTVAVFPILSNPDALINGQVPTASPAIISDWFRFSGRHTVHIEYAVGGQTSQSVYLDLKRGIKVAMPCSSIKVTVYNNFPNTYPLNTSTIVVGASIAAGDSSNNDGLTLTARHVVLLAGGPGTFFGVPPHAKDVTIYTNQAPSGGAFNGAPVAVRFRSIDPTLGDFAIEEFFIPNVGVVNMPTIFGPLPVTGDLTHLDVFNPNLFDINVRVVWGLNL